MVLNTIEYRFSTTHMKGPKRFYFEFGESKLRRSVLHSQKLGFWQKKSFHIVTMDFPKYGR